MLDNKTLLKIVNISLDILYDQDYSLIENNVQEEAIVSAFTRYFDKTITGMNLLQENLSIDNEYNRDILSESKLKEIYYGNEKHSAKPDFILHERGTNDNNILMIEFKKWSNVDSKGKKHDELKLKAFTSKSSAYKYQLGLFIEFRHKRENVVIKKYVGGNLLKNT